MLLTLRSSPKLRILNTLVLSLVKGQVQAIFFYTLRLRSDFNTLSVFSYDIFRGKLTMRALLWVFRHFQFTALDFLTVVKAHDGWSVLV